MTMTRRAALKTMLAGACTEPVFSPLARAKNLLPGGAIETPGEGSEPWTVEWDRALLEGCLKKMDKAYDPAEKMSTSYRGLEYNYQSQLRNTTVHPIRDSFEYALVLLEMGDAERAERAFGILERTLALQEPDPNSKWFGLWSYYMEEPLAKMGAVDFNWADFNGSVLLLIVNRHGKRLSDALLDKVKLGIRQAAISIRRRDITPHYTNIIAQGSFVILAAAELIGDEELLQYGLKRMRHWAAVVDESGSFSEYNSPGYTPFALENLLRIRTMVKNKEALELASRLERRVWLELAAHWHAPTMQLAGPMSRAYSNDIGSPLWLQKGVNNQVVFQTRQQLAEHGGSLPTVFYPYRCPTGLEAQFLSLPEPRQHREVFVAANVLLDTLVPHPAPEALTPVEGTTFLTPRYALGSCNRSDFWVQRRPLLAFYGGRERPSHWMQLRVIKDDYDFSSALFHSVQEGGLVLGAIGFRNDGGDKHPMIDRIKEGAFLFKKMVVEVQFGAWEANYRVLANGERLTLDNAKLPIDARVAIDTGECKIAVAFRDAAFSLAGAGSAVAPVLEWAREQGQAALRLTLFERPQQKIVHWQEIQEAVCALTCVLSDEQRPLAEFDAAASAMPFAAENDAGMARYRWGRKGGANGHSLELRVRRTVGSYAEMESSYAGQIDGRPMPVARLSDERISLPS